MNHSFETTFLVLWCLFGDDCRAVDVFDCLPTFLPSAYVNVFLHFEFQTTVFSQSALLSGLVLSCHQWRITLSSLIVSFNHDWWRSSGSIQVWNRNWGANCGQGWLFVLIFGEKWVIQCIGSIDSFLGVFFKHFNQKIQGWIK